MSKIRPPLEFQTRYDLDGDGDIEIGATTTQTTAGGAQVLVFNPNGSLYQPPGLPYQTWPRYNTRNGAGGDATGIAILVLPPSIVSLLVATSRYYNSLEQLHYLVPIAAINQMLIILEIRLLVYSLRRILHRDRLIQAIKQKHSAIAPYLN